MQRDALGEDDDHRKIDALADRFMAVFTNRGGQAPRLDDLNALLLKACVIVKRTGAELEVMSVEAFIAPRRALLTDGALTDFREQEETARTFVFGGLASRTSTYLKSGVLDGKPFTGRGVKCMHFVRLGHDWRIVSVIWEDEREGLGASDQSWAEIDRRNG